MNPTTIVHNESVCGRAGGGPASPSWLATAQQFLIAGFERLGDWQDRAAQRRRLMTMDPRMLHDVGLCREDAINEAMKPFWKG